MIKNNSETGGDDPDTEQVLVKPEVRTAEELGNGKTVLFRYTAS